MPSKPYVLAIDQGSTNTKAVLVSVDGELQGVSSASVASSYPQPGWVEHDAEELWRSVCSTVEQTLATVREPDIRAIGITNQRESVVAWERETGEPVGPVVSWQCRRTADRCDRLRAGPDAEVVRRKTGLPIDATFSATKMAWLLEHVPAGLRRARAGELCLGTVDAWLLWKLSGGSVFATDAGNASRTQLFDLASGAWDSELLDLFGVPRAALPEVRSTSGIFGETVGGGSMPGGVPIAAVVADSHAALFGHLAADPRAVKATYGTGSSLMGAVSGAPKEVRSLATTVAWARPEATFALEGNITSSGAAIEWMVKLLGVENAEALLVLAGGELRGEEVVFVPAFNGLGAPYWDSSARGLFAGITQGTGREHLARSALEAVAFQIADVFDAFTEAGGGTRLLTDGGASRSDVLMQFQADVLGVPVVRNNSQHLSALGAAFMAGLEVGMWPSIDALHALPSSMDEFEPRWSAQRRSDARQHWRAGVETAIHHGRRGRESAA
jgi:glycerol kinase